MPSIMLRQTMTANGTATPLVGQQYETLPFRAFCEYCILGDAAAVVKASVYAGTDLLMQNVQIDDLAVATPIQYPFYFLLADTIAAGDKQSIVLNEAAGATPIVRIVVRMTPTG